MFGIPNSENMNFLEKHFGLSAVALTEDRLPAAPKSSAALFLNTLPRVDV